MKRILLPVASALCLAATSDAQQPTAMGNDVLGRDSLAKILASRVQAGRSTGLIVGVITPPAPPVFAAAGNERPGRPLDDRTLFEIGSITKAFTGVLLADMAIRGEVQLDLPVSQLLPAGVKVPSRNGRQVTLLDLSTQVSGLTRLPGNMRPANPANPYADYTVQQMYDFLSSHELRRDPGTQYEYSNLGVGLLGHALALRAGKSYEDLVRERILAPLGMTRTSITLNADLNERMSHGHDPSGNVVPPWDLPTLAGAGALRSSLEDMMKFAAAVLSPPPGPVGRAIAASIEPRFRVNQALSLGLNWHRVVMEGDTIIFHNGGTAGFRTYLGVNPRTRTAVVLLGNSANDHEDIARHILQPKMPLVVVKQRQVVELPPAVVSEYAGDYQLTPLLMLRMTVENGALFVQPTGQPRFPAFAEARDRFFLRAVDVELHFDRDSSGAVTSVMLLQNGGRMPGRKLPAGSRP